MGHAVNERSHNLSSQANTLSLPAINNLIYRNLHTSLLQYGDFQIVHTPPFAESITEGDVRWDKEVGDKVELDEVIGEIETDKTALPINSPCAGVIEEFLVEDGATIHKGDDLVKINTSGATGAASPPPAPGPVSETPEASPPPAVTSQAPEPGAPEKLISRTPATPAPRPPA